MHKILFIFSLTLFILFSFGSAPAQNSPVDRLVGTAPAADHHQHVFSPTYAKLQSADFPVVTAKDVIALLDKAGIQRATILSTGFRYGRPGAESADEYNAVKAENDWTAAQAAQYPRRLIAFCGFNPLKDYALEELVRCSKDPNLRRGIKMHFGNSDVQMEVPEHFEKLKKIFQIGRASCRERV